MATRPYSRQGGLCCGRVTSRTAVKTSLQLALVSILLTDDTMSDFRVATEQLEALERHWSRVADAQDATDGSPEDVREQQHALECVQQAMTGETKALMEKLRARCAMVDPVTNAPRFGPKMMSNVQALLGRFDAIEEALNERTEHVEGIATQFTELQAREAALAQEAAAAQARAEAERAQAEARAAQAKAEAQAAAEAAAREAEQQRVATLAALAEQKRQERQAAKAEEEARARAEEARLAALNASIQLGVEGLSRAIELLKKGTGDEATFRTALRNLLAVITNICASPENVTFRHIPKDNVHFHHDLGQFEGGHQCLLALGFRELQQPDSNGVPSSVFTMEEPDLSVDLDAWSSWFDGLKELKEAVALALTSASSNR